MTGDRKPDFQSIGRLIEERRIAVGLRPSELAALAGLGMDPTVGGSRVRAIEFSGKGDLATIVRLLTALSIDDTTVLAVGALDLPAMRVRWEEWAAAPCPVVMSVRLAPAIWKKEPIPDGLDQSGVLEWAATLPTWKHCLRCIRWSRKHCTYIRDDGTSYEVHTAFPENCPEPAMRLQ